MMGDTWALIPCSKSKAVETCTAREMYWPSDLFRGAYETASAAGQRPVILSAEYGLLMPDTVINPYDKTLNGSTPFHRRQWSANVVRNLLNVVKPGDRFVSYLGESYAQYVVGFLVGRGFTVEEPLKGLGQGKRLAWFAQRRRPA